MSLRNEIAKIVKAGLDDYFCEVVANEYDVTDQILALIAPELEKAAKWERVKEIAELGCYVCPFADSFCPIDECKFPMVVKAIDDAMEVEDG